MKPFPTYLKHGFYTTVFRHSIVYACIGVCIIALVAYSCSSTESKASKDKSAQGVSGFKLPAPKSIPEKELKRLTASCKRWADTTLLPNVFNGSIIVAKNGQVVYRHNMGTTHLGGRDSINSNTSFHIASVTKTFTAMIILRMWQEKQLSIDSSFSHYFPEFNYPAVTIRHLLNHRSGLPNYTYFMDDQGWDKKDTVHNRDILDYLIQKKSLLKDIAPAGTRFSYCNTNYVLLALLIEKISGKSYPEYLKEHIFEPLGMHNSFVYTTDKEKSVVPSYNWKGELIPMNHLDAVYGDKNIYSSVNDLLLWDRLLASGLYLQPPILEAAYTPYSNEKPGIRNYGLGWRMSVFPDGTKLIYHNGWWHGNTSALIRMIPEDATIIALGNRFTRSLYKARYLTGLFGSGYMMQDEEENEAVKVSDSVDKKIK